MGYKSWDIYSSSKMLDSEWGYKDETVYINALEVGTRIMIQYLNRVVNFDVCAIDGQNVLKVTSTQNSSLKEGDILFVCKIKRVIFWRRIKCLEG